MRRYNVLHAFFMPFYSKDFYRDVAQNWRHTGYGFLFLFLAICWIPLTWYYSVHLSHWVEQKIIPNLGNVPSVVVKNGELTVDAPTPYLYKDTKTGQVLFIIDTSGQYTNLNQTAAQVLVTKNAILIRSGDKAVKMIPFASNWNFAVTRDNLKNGITAVTKYIIVMTYPVLLLFSFVYRVIQAILYAALGCLILDLFAKSQLCYTAVLRLSVMAIVPPAILAVIFALLNITFPFEWLLYFALAMSYLYFGLRVNRQA